jgi:hypothetical protein
MSKTLTTALMATCAVALLGGIAQAQEFDYGKFDGYTLRVKLIGGTQYEKLYTRIPEWEALTGAKVEIVWTSLRAPSPGASARTTRASPRNTATSISI